MSMLDEHPIMKRVLFLDDMQERHIEFLKMIDSTINSDHVYNARKAIEKLSTERYDIVLLDHDLQQKHYSKDGQTVPSNKDTGAEVAEYIATMKDPPETVIVHSWNSVGGANMVDILSGKVKNIYREAFGIAGGYFNQLLDRLTKS